MAKNRVVFIALLTVLVFIVGCSPTEGEQTNSPEAEPPKSEPNLFEPNQVEPDEAELVETEPNEPEPARTEPKPNDVKPPPKVTFHDKFADILSTFVDDKGMVGYRKLKLRREKLKQLVGEFTKLNRNEYNSWAKEDKIAFWINAYNMQTLKIIIDNYPIESYWLLRFLPTWEPDSIRHINKRIGHIKKQKFYIMDEVFTLPQVEELFGIFRPVLCHSFKSTIAQ
jgi:hypothetical protein